MCEQEIFAPPYFSHSLEQAGVETRLLARGEAISFWGEAEGKPMGFVGEAWGTPLHFGGSHYGNLGLGPV